MVKHEKHGEAGHSPSHDDDTGNNDIWSKNFMELSQKFQEFSNLVLHAQKEKMSQNASTQDFDPLNLNKSFALLSQELMKDPNALIKKQTELWGDYMNLWMQTSRKFMGVESEAIIEPAKDDKRFKDAEWNENIIFDLIKQSYLVTVRATQALVQEKEGLDDKTAKRLDFYTKQFLDALSPTNFAMTNPKVLKETMESNGENLVNGIDNLLEDFKKGDGERLKISMTDAQAFTLGENIATTPGNVVMRNKMVELLQFTPTTKQAFARPILIIPPWINKYYILDLRPANSLIKWLTDQGHRVYCVSWVNPDASFKEVGFEDYMNFGPIASLDAIKEDCGEEQIHAVGYCIGGTLLASTLALMAKDKDKRIQSATYFTTMVDFKDPGDLGVFIDEEQIAALEETMSERGYLDGSEMATSFNMLRSNDLIWSFVINNYLLGKQPFPFDLLYWNSDSTRMPYKMHSFYLRKMYLENKLVQKNAIKLNGKGVDLSKITIPSFILSTREDHIAPWKSTFAATQHYKGATEFILAGSGHIAGVINPPNPDKQKYGYWTNDNIGDDPEKWLAQATHHEGSWWPYWAKWLEKQAPEKLDEKINAPNKTLGSLKKEALGGLNKEALGSFKKEALGSAPGTYAAMR